MKRSASGRRAPMLADHAERLLKCLALGSSESWKPHSAGDCSPTHEPPTRVLLKGGVESSQAETSALRPCFSHAASCASTELRFVAPKLPSRTEKLAACAAAS